MSMLGTPTGSTFTDWIANTNGESVLNVNNGENGPAIDWINDKWNKNIRDQRDEYKKEAEEGPNWEMYFGIGAVVFIIGSILGK